MSELTFRQLEELLERQATNKNWRDFPIVMTDNYIPVRDIRFDRQIVGQGHAVVIILEP